MPITEYDWEAMSDRDIFLMQLKNEAPCFGYISITRRRSFIDFLVKHGYIKFYTHATDFFAGFMERKYENLYFTERTFCYRALRGYRDAVYCVERESMMATTKSNQLIDLGNQPQLRAARHS